MSAVDSVPQVVLKPRKAQPFFSGHPWVFAGAIRDIPASLEAGEEILLSSHEGQPIARGLYNPNSQIKVRLYSWNVDQPLDENFFRERLRSAIELRQRIFLDPRQWKMSRLVFSEADGLSGLVIDSFDSWLSVQFTSLALAQRREMFCDLLDELVEPFGIWLRTEKGMTTAEGLDLKDGPLRGDPPPCPLFIRENELDYRIDLRAGQKTGFYFDQRENRLAAARFLQGEVLDVCCYSGGFGLNALTHGRASHVTAVDSSANALELAKVNAELNGLTDQFTFQDSDALSFLESTADQYDGIILDPPKFARSRGGLNRAKKAYQKWNAAALKRLRSGGILVTCSCSGLISADEFRDCVRNASLQTKRPLRILEARGQACDHPVGLHCPENAYLKCLICAVD